MENFFHTYSTELIIGGASSAGATVGTILRIIYNKIFAMDKRIVQLEKDVAVNSALKKAKLRK